MAKLDSSGDITAFAPYLREIIGKAQQHRSVLAGVKFVSIAPEDQREIMRHVILSLQPRSAS